MRSSSTGTSWPRLRAARLRTRDREHPRERRDQAASRPRAGRGLPRDQALQRRRERLARRRLRRLPRARGGAARGGGALDAGLPRPCQVVEDPQRRQARLRPVLRPAVHAPDLRLRPGRSLRHVLQHQVQPLPHRQHRRHALRGAVAERALLGGDGPDRLASLRRAHDVRLSLPAAQDQRVPLGAQARCPGAGRPGGRASRAPELHLAGGGVRVLSPSAAPGRRACRRSFSATTPARSSTVGCSG